MKYKVLNAAYKTWVAEPTEDNMNALLTQARALVVYRYKKVDTAYEDIAQIAITRVWRSLVGDLKPYDPKRGDFAKYVVGQAISSRKNFYRTDRLVLVEQDILEKFQQDASFRMPLATDPIEAVEK